MRSRIRCSASIAPRRRKSLGKEQDNADKTALAGLRVVELCEDIAGPYCAKVLADLGADVVKLERPGRGDPARRVGPFPNDVPHTERSGHFLYLNTNKLGVTLDVASTTGRRLLMDLLREADVLVEDLSPGEADRLGLSRDALAAHLPELIVTSVSPFGDSGPYRDWRAHHLNLYHGSGHSAFFFLDPAEAPKGPVVGGGSVGDYDAGLSAAVATLGAVLSRRPEGRGQQVEVSKLEALLALERVEVGRFSNDYTPVKRPGMVGGMVPSKDGHVIFAAVQDRQWDGMVKLMGSPAWALDEKCSTELSRFQHRDELQEKIIEWATQHTGEEIYHRGQERGVPIGIVRTARSVMDWVQPRDRGFFAEIDHPEAGRFEYPTAAYSFSETPWRLERPAPLLGEHNEEIYCRRLGRSHRDLARLRSVEVI